MHRCVRSSRCSKPSPTNRSSPAPASPHQSPRHTAPPTSTPPRVHTRHPDRLRSARFSSRSITTRPAFAQRRTVVAFTPNKPAASATPTPGQSIRTGPHKRPTTPRSTRTSHTPCCTPSTPSIQPPNPTTPSPNPSIRLSSARNTKLKDRNPRSYVLSFPTRAPPPSLRRRAHATNNRRSISSIYKKTNPRPCAHK